MTRNAELFRKIADQIRREPKSHCQVSWGLPAPDTPCGTRACIAGWAVVLDQGYRPTENIKTVGEYGHCRVWSSESGPDIYERDIGPMAAELLGLTATEQRILFGSSFESPANYEMPEYLEAVADGAPIENWIDEDWEPISMHWSES